MELTKSFILDMCANYHVSVVQIVQNDKDDDGYEQVLIAVSDTKVLKIAYNYYCDLPLSMSVCDFDFLDSCGFLPNELPAEVLKELLNSFKQQEKDRRNNFYNQ